MTDIAGKRTPKKKAQYKDKDMYDSDKLCQGYREIFDMLSRASYWGRLLCRVNHLYSGYSVYPDYEDIFRAFYLTPYQSTKVVILGQDPYHGGQANGLAFSVNSDVPTPPSLCNILKEVKDDYGDCSTGGDLTSWAKEGVLLLNCALSVQRGHPQSHSMIWQEFCDDIIRHLNRLENIVWLLWGRHAKSKLQLIDGKRHCILTAAHPSPLSAHNGYFGCRHFSKTNAYLTKHNKQAIAW